MQPPMQIDDEIMQGLVEKCGILIEIHNENPHNEHKLPDIDKFTQKDVDYVLVKGLSHFAIAATHLNPDLIYMSPTEAREYPIKEEKIRKGYPEERYIGLSKAQQVYFDSRNKLPYPILQEAYAAWKSSKVHTFASLARRYGVTTATMQRLLLREDYYANQGRPDDQPQTPS